MHAVKVDTTQVSCGVPLDGGAEWRACYTLRAAGRDIFEWVAKIGYSVIPVYDCTPGDYMQCVMVPARARVSGPGCAYPTAQA